MAGVRIPQLDVAKIVGVFGGGPVECAAACQSVGFSVPVVRVRRWVQRNKIPMDGWLMIGWAWELTRGTILDLSAFRKVKS